MGRLVVSGAAAQCSFGMAPGTITATPTSRARAGAPAVTVNDIQAFSNIGAFGMCQSLANPTVAAATSAASGTLTPQPCVPAIAGPWTPGSPRVVVGGLPVVDEASTCTCAWAGQVTITFPGQVRAQAG